MVSAVNHAELAGGMDLWIKRCHIKLPRCLPYIPLSKTS